MKTAVIVARVLPGLPFHWHGDLFGILEAFLVFAYRTSFAGIFAAKAEPA